MVSDGWEVFKVNGKTYDYNPKDKIEGFSGDTFLTVLMKYQMRIIIKVLL